MCYAKPGLHCTDHAEAATTSAAKDLQAAYPDAPAVDPTTAAAAQFDPSAGAVLEGAHRPARVGDRIFHPVYGAGTIKSMRPALAAYQPLDVQWDAPPSGERARSVFRSCDLRALRPGTETPDYRASAWPILPER